MRVVRYRILYFTRRRCSVLLEDDFLFSTFQWKSYGVCYCILFEDIGRRCRIILESVFLLVCFNINCMRNACGFLSNFTFCRKEMQNSFWKRLGSSYEFKIWRLSCMIHGYLLVLSYWIRFVPDMFVWLWCLVLEILYTERALRFSCKGPKIREMFSNCPHGHDIDGICSHVGM